MKPSRWDRNRTLLGLSSNGVAQQQTTDFHQHTASPAGARFEVIQSELAGKWTFRLSATVGSLWECQHGKSISQFGQLIVLLAPLYQPGSQTFTNHYTYDPPFKTLGKWIGHLLEVNAENNAGG